LILPIAVCRTLLQLLLMCTMLSQMQLLLALLCSLLLALLCSLLLALLSLRAANGSSIGSLRRTVLLGT
jgi:hypothetical protein